LHKALVRSSRLTSCICVGFTDKQQTAELTPITSENVADFCYSRNIAILVDSLLYALVYVGL